MKVCRFPVIAMLLCCSAQFGCGFITSTCTCDCDIPGTGVESVVGTICQDITYADESTFTPPNDLAILEAKGVCNGLDGTFDEGSCACVVDPSHAFLGDGCPAPRVAATLTPVPDARFAAR